MFLILYYIILYKAAMLAEDITGNARGDQTILFDLYTCITNWNRKKKKEDFLVNKCILTNIDAQHFFFKFNFRSNSNVS